MVSRGSNRARWKARLIIASIVALAGVWSSSADWEAPQRLDEWHEGPVRYLMSRTEVRVFERLDSDEERLAFIRRFWDRRDPEPRTPENELRLEFWARVQESNRRFSDSVYPGWKTDRGKIFILLGPPDDTERDLYYDTGRDVGNRGLLRWHYEGRRRPTAAAVTVIAFVRDIGGDWKITDDPRLSSMFFDMHGITWDDRFRDLTGLTGSMERLMNGVPWGDSRMDIAMDLAQLQEVPTEHELLETVVEAEDFVGTLTGSVSVDKRISPAGEPLASITLAVRRDDLDPPWDGSATSLGTRFVVSAQLTRAVAGAAPERIEIPAETFVAEPAPVEGDPWLRFQAVRPVPAGSWRLAGAIMDRRGGGSAVIRHSVEVPAAAQSGPRLSGPVLARSIRQSQGPSQPGAVTEPFRHWDQLVIPRMRPELSVDEPFSLYVEAHSPSDLPEQPVRLEWTILHAEPGSDTFEPLAPPGSVEDGRGPRAWTYPPGRLPAGEFELTFEATDSKGRTTVRKIRFTVSQPESDRAGAG